MGQLGAVISRTVWPGAVGLGEEGLSRFFSLTAPFLDERQRCLLGASMVEVLGRGGSGRTSIYRMRPFLRSVGSNPLLFEVLNQIDGLGKDVDVTFLLTTNRVDILERALAERSGRVDAAADRQTDGQLVVDGALLSEAARELLGDRPTLTRAVLGGAEEPDGRQTHLPA
jgi:hypothetical protein